jgi:hypothetical protein
MTVEELWKPTIDNLVWTGPGDYGSSFFTNPWSTTKQPACDVWIQLTSGMLFAEDSPSYLGFCVIELEYVGSSGVEQKTYGDINDLADANFPTLPVIMYQRNLLSFTVAWAAPGIYAIVVPTLMKWG